MDPWKTARQAEAGRRATGASGRNSSGVFSSTGEKCTLKCVWFVVSHSSSCLRVVQVRAFEGRLRLVFHAVFWLWAASGAPKVDNWVRLSTAFNCSKREFLAGFQLCGLFIERFLGQTFHLVSPSSSSETTWINHNSKKPRQWFILMYGWDHAAGVWSQSVT